MGRKDLVGRRTKETIQRGPRQKLGPDLIESRKVREVERQSARRKNLLPRFSSGAAPPAGCRVDHTVISEAVHIPSRTRKILI